MEGDRILPAVGLLQIISPDSSRLDTDRLIYPRLAGASRGRQSIEDVLLRTYRETEDQSATQLVAAFRLAECELIQMAESLQTAETHEQQRALSRQFTAASIDMFGAPDSVAALYLLDRLMTELCILQTNPAVDRGALEQLSEAYGEILDACDAPHEYVLPAAADDADAAAEAVERHLRHEYDDVLLVFAGNPYETLQATQIADLFRDALGILKVRDKVWGDWRVMLVDETCLSINPEARQIVVGRNRLPVARYELEGLFGHEILVHANRTNNGQLINEAFELGLPGYIDAEEGLGCFVEHALTHQPPRKMYDRYLDVALALGVLDGRSRTRRELYRMVYARNLVRAQAEAQDTAPAALRRESWVHVNRIFRGTLGNDIVGVFTKDVAYYQGYQKITEFIVDGLANGADIGDLWRTITLGKFDPTDTSHIIELARYL